MNKNGTKSRRYCFTINNYTKKFLKSFHVLAETCKDHRFICYGLEVGGKKGTEHIQGYIELNKAQRYTFLHNYFNFKKDGKTVKFHIDIASGTAKDNKRYTKKDGEYFEFGEPLTQGERTDLTEIKKLIEENPKNLNKIIREHGNNLQQVRYAQIIQPIYLTERDSNVPPKVFWIFGPSGIGKTKLVYDTFEDVCAVSSYQWLGTAYNQNECFLLDDFRRDNLPFEDILKITDRYPFTLFFKGSQIPLNSPFIIFTSPQSISATFKNVGEELKQLKRRIREIDLASIKDVKEVNLRNLDEKHIFNDNYSIHDDF